MALTLHYHPLSSYCWKVLIALYEKGLAFEPRMVNFGDAAEREKFASLWPTGKIPLLDDGGTIVPETSIMIEHLDRHAGTARLIPADPDAALRARLWDRISDCYIMDPMQRFIAQQLRPAEARDERACQDFKSALSAGYDLYEKRLGDRTWAAGEDFTIAECAAAPAFFYATTIVPIPDSLATCKAYSERLFARASVQRTIREAVPFFQYYPLQSAIPARFLAPSG